MKDMNRVFLMGRLGATPELNEGKNGRRFTRLRVATDRSYTDAEGEVHEGTDWHSVFVWGRQAEVCAERLRKGEVVFIDGHLTYWQEEGGKMFKSAIHATSVHFIGRERSAHVDNLHGDGDPNAVAHPA